MFYNKTLLFAVILIFISNIYQSYSQWELVNDTSGEVLFVNDNTGFMVSNSLFKTTNQGLNWISMSIPTVGTMLDISFPNQNIGYICANSGGRFLKTTDGGANWTLLYTNVANFGQYSIDFHDANTGFIVGSGGGNPNSISIIKTTNGGLNWTVNLQSSAHLQKVKMINSQEIIAIGTKVYRSSNGGINWNEINFSQTLQFWDIDFINNFGYMVRDAYNNMSWACVYRTSDYGITWQAVQLTGKRLLGVHFLNESYGFVCGFDGIYRTTNSGQNWIQDTSIFISSINGNSNYVFASGTQGLYRLSNPIGIIQISNELPTNYKLHQNYPNPFNPNTNIKFDISTTGIVTLKIFNAVGQEIELLVNQELQIGSYQVDWKATKYPSGIYFYRLETNKYTETKKMVLSK